MFPRLFNRAAIAALTLLLVLSAHAQDHRRIPPAKAETALDRYIAKPDPTYAWKAINTVDGGDFIFTVLEVTSQTWRSAEEVDRPVWKHHVTITRPKETLLNTAMLYIDGGGSESKAPEKPEMLLAHIAVATKGAVCNIRQIPNQPLTFKEDGVPRKEDHMIAYSWRKYMETGDEEWPARLPMTKGAVRAMDAIQEYLASDEGGKVEIKDFVVAGGSKRGWTTWAAAAVDTRVKGIIPAVIDCLNVIPSFKHHFEAYGFWAPAVGDYVAEGVMDWMGAKEYDALLAIEDPFVYRARYTMPKLIVNSAGDQFFLPDSTQFYYDELIGPKYLRYVPNSDHGLDKTDAPASLHAFYNAVAKDLPIPTYDWKFATKDSIQVTTGEKPVEVLLWQASNENARDFRQETIGNAWTSTPVEADKKGAFAVKLDTPEKGWSAYLVELTFNGQDGTQFKFTTPVRILPDTLPHTYTYPAEIKKGFLSKEK